ncbi:MAG: hypothetical protein U5K54_14555 [Cytophagales bacterium]|nr:hypothetical protein [Cytophagales bacterium]
MKCRHRVFPAGLEVPQGGIAVVADSTWAAISARKTLQVEWDFGVNASYDSENLSRRP